MPHVQVKTKASDKFGQEIKAEGHSFISDAPEAVGGGATGPDPHELLLGSLGACTNITLQMYAKKRLGFEGCRDRSQRRASRRPTKPRQENLAHHSRYQGSRRSE